MFCNAGHLRRLRFDAHSVVARNPRPQRRGDIALTAVSIVVMPLLAPRQTAGGGEASCSGAVRADARQTEFCMYLSAIVLGGLASMRSRLVVGGPAGRPGDGPHHRQRRHRRRCAVKPAAA